MLPQIIKLEQLQKEAEIPLQKGIKLITKGLVRDKKNKERSQYPDYVFTTTTQSKVMSATQQTVPFA